MKELERRKGAQNDAGKTDQGRPDTGDVSSSAMDQGDESSINSDSVPVRIIFMYIVFLLDDKLTLSTCT